VTLDELRARLEHDGQLVLAIKAVPKSARSEIVGWLDDGTLKVRIAAAPEKGRANAELCSFLARTFGLPQRNVTLVAGETSSHKRVRLLRGA
jgi:uncharacterized protein (TIGR00251 family)